jgi:uncharacterized protein (TIGR02246 family)
MTTNATSEIRTAIAAANQEFMSAFARGDAAGMAACYTANGQLLPTHSEVVTGTQSIGAFWQAVMNMGIKQVTLQTLELEAHGDTAHEVGAYTLRGSSGEVLDQGKYIVIWKHDGGRWKLHRDIWNSSAPAPRT